MTTFLLLSCTSCRETDPIKQDADLIIDEINDFIEQEIEINDKDFEILEEDSEVDKDIIRIRVVDTGIGIPPDLLDTVFEAFSQVDTSTTRKAGGTGLGLPISKQFIEMHKGRIWAESSGHAGEGSIFIIELPIVLPPDAEEQ